MPSCLPTLLPNRCGYALGDEIVEGFRDRPELDETQRSRIARWADRFGHQNEFQSTVTPTGEDEAEILAVGLIASGQELQKLHLKGELEKLSKTQRGWLAHPSTHPEAPDASYPLSIGELALLAKVSVDQVHSWMSTGSLPSFLVGQERCFGRGGVAHAMLLAKG